MNSKKFLYATLQELESLTGIASSRWSRYFSGKKQIQEETLNRAAKTMGVAPNELLKVINQRRTLLTDNRFKSGVKQKTTTS